MQTRGVRGQKMPKNANVICDRSLIGREGVRNFAIFANFHIKTKGKGGQKIKTITYVIHEWSPRMKLVVALGCTKAHERARTKPE